MGSVFSKGRRRARSSSLVDVNGSSSTSSTMADGSSNKAQFMAELRSYEAACKVDPELQSFDKTLQQRTTHAISTVAVAGVLEFRSFSFNSLKEITSCLLDTNQDVARIILECKRDVWNNPELFSLVEEYFENSLRTLDFCTALEKCLMKARDSQLIIQIALRCFEEEEMEKEGNMDKYARTLEELRSFKTAGDPFGEEFFKVFQSVRDQELLMLKKLRLRKQKLDKKLRSVKAWRKLSSIIFASAFAAVIVCSVVAAAMAAPPVAATLAALASVPVGTMGKWFDSLWKKYQDAVKGQRDLISSMEAGTYIAIKDLENIRVLVDQLEIVIDSLLRAADFALRDEEAVKFGVRDIKLKLGDFMKGVEDLVARVDRCTRDVGKARALVLHSIMKYPE